MVLVAAGGIAAVGPRTEVKIPVGAATIDAAGKTLIPGLIDLHSTIHHCRLIPTP